MLRGINTHMHTRRVGHGEQDPQDQQGFGGHRHASVNQLGAVTAWHLACGATRRTVSSNGP